MQIEIRPVSQEQVPSLIDLVRETYIETYKDHLTPEEVQDRLKKNYSSETLTQEIGNPINHFFVVLKNGQVIAYMQLYEKESHLMLYRIYVKLGFQKLGIGKLMIEKCQEIGKNWKCKAIVLRCYEHNHGALKFYEKCGFEFVKKEIFSILIEKPARYDHVLKKEIT